ncbi:MAG: response regulator [Lachnospiraceae bacterium]|nr:response regulator [Lachnospiraceae bacterium]
MVVEDEKVIRNGLLRHVKWEQCEVDEVRAAANAEEAYAICRDFMPDIITSDIRMPGSDGITLCRRLREEFPDTEIIFITGYADKEYLMAAIDLHAVRYIEKPVQITAYQEAVLEAVQLIRQVRRREEAAFHVLFRNASADSFHLNWKLNHTIGLLHLKGQPDLYALKEHLLSPLKPIFLKYGMRLLMEVLPDNLLGFLFDSGHLDLKKTQLAEISHVICACVADKGSWFLTFGTTGSGKECLVRSWQEAYYAQKALSYTGWNHVLYPGDTEPQKPSLPLKIEDGFTDQWASLLAKQEQKQAQNFLDELLASLKEQKVLMDSNVHYLYVTLDQSLSKAEKYLFPSRKEEAALAAEEKSRIEYLEQLETCEELHNCLSKRLRNLYRTECLSGKIPYAVQKVIGYIHKNYADSSLSIRVLADYVGLAPTYLSNLFKKSQNLTINQYLADYRMEQAKRLLRDPQLKFYEVANLVGYEDSNYFARLFKKQNGCTLSEYKERQLLK